MSRAVRRGLALLAAALALAGCQTRPAREHVATATAAPAVILAPPPVVAAVAPRAARACVPRTLNPPPRYPDSDAALRDAPGAADRYQLMAAGRLMRQRRLEELERIVAGCR